MPVALLAFGGLLKRAGIAAFGWLSHRSIAELALIAVTLFALVQHFELAHSRSQSARWQKQFQSEHAARIADRKSYETAQVQAKAKNEATLQRVKHEQETITDRVKSDYARDLDRLRHQAAPGIARGAQASPDGKAAGGTDADGLRLSPDEHLQASEIELRLMYLQNWVDEQLRVDPNAR
jgi:hypothetical protein